MTEIDAAGVYTDCGSKCSSVLRIYTAGICTSRGIAKIGASLSIPLHAHTVSISNFRMAHLPTIVLSSKSAMRASVADAGSDGGASCSACGVVGAGCKVLVQPDMVTKNSVIASSHCGVFVICTPPHCYNVIQHSPHTILCSPAW